MCTDEDFQLVLERIGRVFHDAAQVRTAISVFAALDTASTRRVDAGHNLAAAAARSAAA